MKRWQVLAGGGSLLALACSGIAYGIHSDPASRVGAVVESWRLSSTTYPDGSLFGRKVVSLTKFRSTTEGAFGLKTRTEMLIGITQLEGNVLFIAGSDSEQLEIARSTAQELCGQIIKTKNTETNLGGGNAPAQAVEPEKPRPGCLERRAS